MSKRENQKPFKPVRNVLNTCSVCGTKSKQVNKSIKFNQYFCMDCLVEHVKNNINNL